MDNRNLSGQHLIIPFASSLDDGSQMATGKLNLPHLTRFLKQAELVDRDDGDEFDFIPPHERVWLKANPDKTPQPSITLTPCHWLVGIDRISMTDPVDLQLTEAESQSLFNLMRPYFVEDGIELMYAAPLRWYAMGECLNGVTFASLDRVIGRNVDAWQPAASHSKAIRRLQNEMQMLLYTHPINEARAAQGLPTVNSFWLSHDIQPLGDVDQSLRAPAMASDWASWTSAWQRLDATLPHVQTLTLCGERNAHTYSIAHSRSIGEKIQRLFKPSPSAASTLTTL